MNAVQEFDAILNAVLDIGRIGQVRDLRRRIVGLRQIHCGDCSHWMKSSQCPKERNVNGRNRGPSCEDRICEKFEHDKLKATQTELLISKVEQQIQSLQQPSALAETLESSSETLATAPQAQDASSTNLKKQLAVPNQGEEI